MKKCFLFIIVIASCTPVKKAQESYDSGSYRETIGICRTALLQDSTNADIYALLGDSYYKLGHLDSALWASENAHKLNELSKSKELIFKIHSIYADSLMAQKEYRKAIEKYDVALLYYPQEPHVLEKIADAHFSLGRYDTSLEKYIQILAFVEDSTSILEKIQKIENSRDESDKLIESGVSLLTRNKYSNAKKVFEKALKIKPDHKEAKYYLLITNGHILFKRGKVGTLWDAIEQYGLASALKPELAGPHYFMGLAYHRKEKKEYENAFREFEQAIRLEPQSEYAKLASEKLKDEQRRKKLLKDFWNKGKK